MSEINEGVRILVERMKTNPEEFQEGVVSKWAHVVRIAADAKWMTDEERKLLDDAANEVQRNAFTARVLEALTQGEEFDHPSEVQAKKHLRLNPSQVAMVKNQLAGGTLTTTSGWNGTSWTNGAITSSNVGVSSQYATKDDLKDALANYARAMYDREEGQP